MNKKLLNDQQTEIPGLSLGTWAFSGAKLWGDNNEEDSIKTVHAALDRGINLIDTAEAYGDGQSELVLGKAIKDRRSKVLLATKVYSDHLYYNDVIRCCEDSLKRLQTDYIDLYQIHWPNPEINSDETMDALMKLKKDGKIRNIGVCNHGIETLKKIKDYPIVTNQMPYSILWRVVEHHFGGQVEEQNIRIWAYSPLSQGLLTGKFKTLEDVPVNRRANRMYDSKWGAARHDGSGFEKEIFELLNQLSDICKETGYTMSSLAFGFLKSRKNVGSILVGARNIAQLDDNVKAYDVDIPEEIINKITMASEQLKSIMGTNADLYEGDLNGGRIK